jgi:hypothetical protein
MNKARYAVILADPPWKYRAWKGDRGMRTAESFYKTMTAQALHALRPRIDEWAAKDCALFLWATPPALPEAMDLISAWGFIYTTFGFTWIKTTKAGEPRMGMGWHTRANADRAAWVAHAKTRVVGPLYLGRATVGSLGHGSNLGRGVRRFESSSCSSIVVVPRRSLAQIARSLQTVFNFLDLGPEIFEHPALAVEAVNLGVAKYFDRFRKGELGLFKNPINLLQVVDAFRGCLNLLRRRLVDSVHKNSRF